MDGETTLAIAGTLSVLVADDNPVSRRLACHLLGRRGYRARAVNNGRAAVTAIAAETFDIVLMNVQMPVMGGLQAARLIRAYEQLSGRHTPIVALTAHAWAGDCAGYLAAGMDDCLAKPLKAAELFAVIERATGNVARASAAETAGWTGARAAAQACAVDLDVLRAEVGDEETVVNLCRLFTQDVAQLLDELAGALAAGDMERLCRGAQRLQGTVRVFHAPQAVARLGELEAAARAGDVLRAHAECNASRRMLAALAAQLSEAQGMVAA
jgi:two-component system sensor histidine kinase/response regulator